MTVVSNQRRSIRITVLLITAIASLVTLSTGIVLVLSGMAAFRSTFELLSDTATLTMEAVETEVRSHVIPARQIVSHVTTLVERGDIDPANRQQMVTAMKGAMAAAPQIAGLVYWDSENIELRVGRLPDGTVAAAPTQQITDPYILASIERVKTTGTPSWGPPVFNDGATYVYVAGPLVHTGSFLGVLTSGVTISELSSKVDRIGRHLDITAFVLFGNDHVLAHPELIGTTGNNAFISEQNPLLPITELKDAVLRRFHHAEPHRDHQIENVTVRNINANGQEYLAMSRSMTEFGGTPWHIGIYATMDSLDDQVRRLVGAMIAGLGVLGLAIVGAIVLARYIARPIRNIASVADRVGRFELTDITAVPRSRIKELDEQAVAFNRMLDGLRWFETYVPKSLVHRLIAGQDGQSVPSGEQEVTVMFTDIIGFTAMTEHMAPADVATMLNRQFEVINQCIEAEGGTLDKYIGDSVMAFWGAPEHQPDHAERACRAALHIARAVAEDAADGIKHPPIRLKIAVHTGRLLVGNIGAMARMNYTVIGDTVNTCSRIETLCGEFDTGDGSIILVSGDTMAQARTGTGLVFEDAGSFTVKGRQEPVHVSKLTGSQNVTL